MGNIDQLMQGDFNNDPEYEEEWEVITSAKGKYTLSKLQARVLMQEMANGNRGVIPFKTFAISIPYIVEFYRVKRFLKDAKQLPERASEKPYEPIPAEKWEKIKRELFINWAK